MVCIVNNVNLEINHLKQNILDKIKHLSSDLSAELALHQPIIIKLPENYNKRVKAYQKKLRKIKKKILQIQHSGLVEPFEKELRDIEMKLKHLLAEKHQQPLGESQITNPAIKKLLSIPLLRMKAKLAIQRMKRFMMNAHLQALNMFFVYGVQEEAMKDAWFQQQSQWHGLRFSACQQLPEKTMFLMLGMYINDLLDLIPHNIPDVHIKERFMKRCEKVALEQDISFVQYTSQTLKLKRIAQKLLLQKSLKNMLC